LFTGLVKEVGKVLSLRRSSTGAVLSVETGQGFSLGDSVAVNGVCQTVSRLERNGFSCDVLPETLRVTNIGYLEPGSRVNLEKALRPGDEIGGHIVNGHVDGMGLVRTIRRRPFSVGIEVDEGIFEYVVPKGPVAVDGISLTIGPKPRNGYFEVFIIPHTWDNTNLAFLSPGRRVNIEVDIIAKYVKRFSGGSADY
jgi:riboflavin synthase